MSEEVQKLKTELKNLHSEYSDVSKHQKQRIAELEKALRTVHDSFDELGRELVGQTFGEEDNLLDIVSAVITKE